MRHRHMMKAAALALGSSILGSALPAQTAMETDTGTAMRDRIETFTAAGPSGARLPLAGITGFEWDTVHGFAPNTPSQLYRARLGDAYRMGEELRTSLTDDTAVLVFSKDGKVVGEVPVGPPVFIMGLDAEPHGPAAALTVTSDDPGPYTALNLTE